MSGPDAELLAHVYRSGLPIIALVGCGDDSADWGLIDGADAHVLADDDAAVIAAVLARAIAGSSEMSVADMSDGTVRTMQALSVEAARVAERLAMLAAAQATIPPTVRPINAALVRRMIKLRRDRDRYLPAEILADPA